MKEIVCHRKQCRHIDSDNNHCHCFLVTMEGGLSKWKNARWIEVRFDPAKYCEFFSPREE